MNTRFFLNTSILLLAILGPAGPANAVTGTLTTTVVRTLVSNESIYGGCMASLAAAINTANVSAGQSAVIVNCPTTYVSFSCTGVHNSKDLAFYMLDQAQLALSLSKTVSVTVDDTKKHNGYCVATRIDVIK